MQFSKKFLIGSIVALVVLLLLWNTAEHNGWFSAKASEKDKAGETGPQGEKKQKLDNAYQSIDEVMGGKETPITVEAAPVSRGQLVQKVSAQGRVHAYQQLDLVNEVAGRLIRFGVADGDRVKKGQLIAEIDDREYRLDFEEAQSSYRGAQADYVVYDESLNNLAKNSDSSEKAVEELEKQFKSGLISKSELEKKKFELELDAVRSGSMRGEVIAAKTLTQAKIRLEKSRISLEKCKVFAPFDGVIFGVEVSEGQLLANATKLARLVNMTNLVVKAKVLESEIGQVFKDRNAKISFTALPDLGAIEGKVRAVSPFINEEDKTVETVVGFQSIDSRIRPGMFAEVNIDAQMYDDILMVPKLAILPRNNRKVIFKVGEDNRAKWLYVTTGVENDNFVQILEGKLEPGDMVLTDNHFTMGHDTLVKISE